MQEDWIIISDFENGSETNEHIEEQIETSEAEKEPISEITINTEEQTEEQSEEHIEENTEVIESVQEKKVDPLLWRRFIKPFKTHPYGINNRPILSTPTLLMRMIVEDMYPPMILDELELFSIFSIHKNFVEYYVRAVSYGVSEFIHAFVRTYGFLINRKDTEELIGYVGDAFHSCMDYYKDKFERQKPINDMKISYYFIQIRY